MGDPEELQEPQEKNKLNIYFSNAYINLKIWKNYHFWSKLLNF